MKKQQNINEKDGITWVNQVLESVDGIERAPANPFLYTRIIARMQEANSRWEKIARFVTKPSFAIAATTLFLALNMWVIMQQKAEIEKMKASETDQLFATEYNTMQYSLIDLTERK